MNRFFLAILIVMLLASNSQAEEDRYRWTRRDTLAEAVTLIPYVLDWMQSRTVAKERWQEVYIEYADGTSGHVANPKWHEVNPILGNHPSVRKVDAFFAAAIIGNILVARSLPNPYRRIWQAATFGWELGFVISNNSIGVKIDF